MPSWRDAKAEAMTLIVNRPKATPQSALFLAFTMTLQILIYPAAWVKRKACCEARPSVWEPGITGAWVDAADSGAWAVAKPTPDIELELQGVLRQRDN